MTSLPLAVVPTAEPEVQEAAEAPTAFRHTSGIIPTLQYAPIASPSLRLLRSDLILGTRPPQGCGQAPPPHQGALSNLTRMFFHKPRLSCTNLLTCTRIQSPNHLLFTSRLSSTPWPVRACGTCLPDSRVDPRAVTPCWLPWTPTISHSSMAAPTSLCALSLCVCRSPARCVCTTTMFVRVYVWCDGDTAAQEHRVDGEPRL
jgi:hypothetical protein